MTFGRLAILLLLALQTPPPVFADDAPPQSPAAEASAPSREEGVVGRAAYYAKRYNGKRTASGKRYRHDGMTAAHATLPLGSRVRVVNLANDREVTVTVTDRCRNRSFPFIDLSRGAAKKLGFLGRGAAKVRIITLSAITS
jgi:rare lipoprotein A